MSTQRRVLGFVGSAILLTALVSVGAALLPLDDMVRLIVTSTALGGGLTVLMFAFFGRRR